MLDDYLSGERLLALRGALKESETILAEELWNAPKALVAALALEATGKHVLILTGGNREEARLFHDFSLFTDAPVLDFPSWETLPSENIPPSPDIVGERYKILRELAGSRSPRIILSSLQACLQRLVPVSVFRSLTLSLKRGQSISFEELIRKLESGGYTKTSIASDKGEYAVRGGIIDVFPVSSPDPFRLEFWGDEIESIRIYDPIGQKSVRSIEEVEIFPGVELELLGKQTDQASLPDYLGENTIVVFDDLLALEDRYASLVSMGSRHPSFCSIEEFLDRVQNLQKIFLSSRPIEEMSEIRSKLSGRFYSEQAPFHPLSFDMFGRGWKAGLWRHPFNTIGGYLFPSDDREYSGEELLAGISAIPENKCKVTFVRSNDSEEGDLRKKIEHLSPTPISGVFRTGYLSGGFVIQDVPLIVFPMTELTGRHKLRRQKLRSTYHTSPVEAYRLDPGETVVHLNNGIGRYLGMELRPNHLGVNSEFFAIEYAENGKLYVPVNQAHHISKYVGSHETAPRLSTIGSPKWKKTREKTEQAIVGYASDLLRSYASRAIARGFAFLPDSPDVAAFEEEFPYTETEDQLEALASIKRDMMSDKAMDRLICGDVGYGKTEVAMRAAFKAVVDGAKQVAVLVPTTVLAMQHYETFAERMSRFPVRVGVLSRFQTAKQTRETLEGLRKGAVDILIGTHRIIGEDVKFKDLGLVIVDEEQRFGVRAKEHLRKIRVGVDCLTLSATPIPRTLYMSLVGARDMSIINTPPQDRIPVKTVISDSSDQTIRNALLRELARDGQAFVIHDRVETIYGLSDRIKKLLPQVSIAVAHGQMDPDEIDTAFHAFKSGRADILVATTIVENGIDIPNANTILIDRADRFGLATLYQVRGRVGRWNRRAYAYFMVPDVSRLPELSRKRLQALAEASGYGGGMKVAMHDLEIRGAGDILGVEQSGHVSAIGFHLYCKLLKRTIQALRGEIPREMTDTKMEFPIDARLPPEYIEETALRMEIYQRLGEASSVEEADSVIAEVRDRFGPLPEPAVWLHHLTRLRIFASRLGFTLLKLEKLSLTLERRKGKENSIRKILAPKFKSPPEMEQKILAELKKS